MITKTRLLALLSVVIVSVGLPGAVAAAPDDGTIAVGPTTPSESPQTGKRDGKRAEGMLEQRLEQLGKNLQLTAEQKEQVKAIWAKEAAAAKGGEGKDRRAAMMEARNQVRALLNSEQQAKFDKMGGQRGGAPGTRKKSKN